MRWNGLLGPETRRETARKPGGAGRKPPARETGKAAADNPAENPFNGGLETPPLGAVMLPPTGREKGFALPGLTLHRLGTRTKPPENPAEPAGNPRPRKRGGRSGRPRRNLIQSGLETPPLGAIILPATGRRKGFRHAGPNVGVKPHGAHSDIRFNGGLPAPWGLNDAAKGRGGQG